MTSKKSTLKQGTTNIYPQTTDDMVFIEGDADNKTLRNFMQETTSEITQLGQEVDISEERIEYECEDNITQNFEKPGTKRLSTGMALPFTGKCDVMMSLVSGTDTRRWRLYRYTSGAVGSALTDYANFGTKVSVTIPDGDDGLWLFTEEDSASGAREYSVVINNIDASVAKRIKDLEKDVPVFGERQIEVNTAAKRTQSFSVKLGMKCRFCASVVSGSGATTYSVYHTSVSSENRIFNGITPGVPTSEYTIPEGVDTIIIFPNAYASGLTYQLIIYNAENNKWLTDQMNAAGVLPYVVNTTPSVIEADLEVSESIQYILGEGLNRPTDKTGDVWLFINSLTAEFDKYGRIRIQATDGSVEDLFGAELELMKPFYVFSGKTIKSIFVYGDSIITAGHISISVYSVLQGNQDLSLPLKGRTIFCFGDSITEFRNGTIGRRYSDYLTILSMANTINAGIGGTRLAQRQTPSATPTTNQECIAAFDMVNIITAWATNNYTNQDAAISSGLLTDAQQSLYEGKIALLKANPIGGADLVTIFGGTNDYTGGTTIGTESAGNTDKGTLYGSINSIVSALLTAKPTLKIYFFSPIIRMFESTVSLSTSSDVYVHTNAPEGKTLPQFNEVIADAVRLNHVPFCDWYWSFGWNVYNFTTFFGTDYTHPYNGFLWIAEKMYQFLLSK